MRRRAPTTSSEGDAARDGAVAPGIVIHQEGEHDVGRYGVESQVVVEPGEFQVCAGFENAEIGPGQFHGFELEPAEIVTMVLPRLSPVGILPAFRHVVEVLVTGDLTTEAALVDDDEIVRIAHGLQVYGNGHVFAGRREILEGQYAEPVEDLAVLARAAQSFAVVRMAVPPTLFTPSDLVVDGLQPGIALSIVVLFRFGHDANDMLGAEHRPHAEPPGESPFVLAAHQLFLRRAHYGGVPDRFPVLTRRSDDGKVGRVLFVGGVVEAIVQVDHLLADPRADQVFRGIDQGNIGSVIGLSDHQDTGTGRAPGKNKIADAGIGVLAAETAAHGRPHGHGHA